MTKQTKTNDISLQFKGEHKRDLRPIPAKIIKRRFE